VPSLATTSGCLSEARTSPLKRSAIGAGRPVGAEEGPPGREPAEAGKRSATVGISGMRRCAVIHDRERPDFGMFGTRNA